jgi:hypothetical protein
MNTLVFKSNWKPKYVAKKQQSLEATVVKKPQG